MKSAIALMIWLLALAASASQSTTGYPSHGGKIVYQCPMKCEGDKTYDKPGTCPVCNMNLRAIDISSGGDSEQASNDDRVNIVGAMMNVMHKGELAGTLSLDTISTKAHLYGVGPVEYLTGEITIFDGVSYVSTLISPRAMNVEETFNVKAPFFVYAAVPRWKEMIVPDSVSTGPQLERYLDQVTKSSPRPFAFRVSGRVKKAVIHVVNLPRGTKVASPDDAHKGEQQFSVKDRDVDLVGFFSTEHQGIFTHHGSYVHLHLITADRKMMGHLDEMQFVRGKMKLYLPEN